MNNKIKQCIIIVIIAITTITICSKSSPIYPFNDWQDINCFMTVGKSMIHGITPYKDIYEQKGPLLYMIYAMVSLISDRSFIGAYILEVVCSIVFLTFGWKLIKLYSNSVSIMIIPVVATIVYTSKSFTHGGSAEEICIPMLIFALYIMMRFIKEGQCISNKEYIVIGITSASILWIKFTMLGFYIGWFLVLTYMFMKNNKLKKIARPIYNIGLGAFIVTIPIIVYFIMKNALADMIKIYFYNNIFCYTRTSNGIVVNLLLGLISAIDINMALVIIILAVLFNKNRKEFYTYVIIYLITFIFIYCGGRNYDYYAFTFSIFTPVGIALAYNKLEKYGNKNIKIVVCVIYIIVTIITSNNTYFIMYKKSDLPQYKFAEIIDKKEDATLLNYNFLDGGFYTVTGIVPNNRFFCRLNIILPEMMQEQNEIIKTGAVDFVVTCDEKLNSDIYKVVSNTQFYYEGRIQEYFLYQKGE